MTTRLPLFRVLPRLGAASRSETRRLAAAGLITVNGAVASDASVLVDPDADQLHVAGRDVAAFARLAPLHLVLHKPRGVVTTSRDPEGRQTVLDLLPAELRRARPVGRLDKASTGLLYLTTDGVLGHEVAASGRVAKEYLVEVNRHPDDAQFDPLRQGLDLDGEACRGAEVSILERRERSTLVRVVLHEGRYRQIRRSMQRIGLRVWALHRVAIGPIAIGALEAGAARELTEDEVRALADAAITP